MDPKILCKPAGDIDASVFEHLCSIEFQLLLAKDIVRSAPIETVAISDSGPITVWRDAVFSRHVATYQA